MKRRIWVWLLFLGVLWITPPVQSQSLIQGEPTEEMRQEARQKVEMWEKELGLRAKQEDLMERKFIEYAIKREKILQTPFPPEQLRDHLLALKLRETRDMRDILTTVQYDRYVTLLEEMAREN